MDIERCFLSGDRILMEGALGERLKREYHISFDEHIMLAGLIYQEAGRTALNGLWRQYIKIAENYNFPFLATTPTRRANRERVQKAGLDRTVIYDNVKFLQRLQQESGIEMYAGGLMGCRGDAYTGEGAMTENDSHEFHGWQANCFKEAGADFLYAGIMPALPEAEGMAKAMSDTALPYIISFTVQKDGMLIDGTTIHRAIADIDDCTEQKPLCYMANCVHPSIVYTALSQPFNETELVKTRFLGIQANTSPLPYTELDGAKDLKCSDPESFAEEMVRLKKDKGLKIMGGCCGTDNRHLEEIARRL